MAREEALAARSPRTPPSPTSCRPNHLQLAHVSGHSPVPIVRLPTSCFSAKQVRANKNGRLHWRGRTNVAAISCQPACWMTDSNWAQSLSIHSIGSPEALLRRAECHVTRRRKYDSDHKRNSIRLISAQLGPLTGWLNCRPIGSRWRGSFGAASIVIVVLVGPYAKIARLEFVCFAELFSRRPYLHTHAHAQAQARSVAHWRRGEEGERQAWLRSRWEAAEITFELAPTPPLEATSTPLRSALA